jgi:hypothetical protein
MRSIRDPLGRQDVRTVSMACMEQARAAVIGAGGIMTRSHLAFPILLAGLGCAAIASAGPVRGQLGEQSRASVRISISVSPRFDVGVEDRSSDGQPARNLARLRNDPGTSSLRFSTVTTEAFTSPAGNPQRLILIVPE